MTTGRVSLIIFLTRKQQIPLGTDIVTSIEIRQLSEFKLNGIVPCNMTFVG